MNVFFKPLLDRAVILMAGVSIALALPSVPVIAAQNAPVYHCVPFVVNTTAPMPSPDHGMNPLNGGNYALLTGSLATLNASPVIVSISGIPLTGPGGAGAVCRQDAIHLFQGVAYTPANGLNGITAHPSNTEWSDPNKLCARPAYHDGKHHTIGVYEIITEVGGAVTGHTGGYNLVAGYTVTCKGNNPHTNLAVPVVASTLP